MKCISTASRLLFLSGKVEYAEHTSARENRQAIFTHSRERNKRLLYRKRDSEAFKISQIPNHVSLISNGSLRSRYLSNYVTLLFHLLGDTLRHA